MAWNDDSWKDGYDAWKLRSPDDDLPEPPCEHEDFEITWEGRAICERCGERWWPSKNEQEHFRYLNALYDEHCRREERKQWWRDQWQRFGAPWRWFWYGVFTKLGMHKRAVRSLSIDDHIPF